MANRPPLPPTLPPSQDQERTKNRLSRLKKPQFLLGFGLRIVCMASSSTLDTHLFSLFIFSLSLSLFLFSHLHRKIIQRLLAEEEESKLNCVNWTSGEIDLTPLQRDNRQPQTL